MNKYLIRFSVDGEKTVENCDKFINELVSALNACGDYNVIQHYYHVMHGNDCLGVGVFIVTNRRYYFKDVIANITPRARIVRILPILMGAEIDEFLNPPAKPTPADDTVPW